MRNHLGTFECKLCLTLHNNEASYLAHTQGKKHQSNLARRAAKEAKDAPVQPAPLKAGVDIKKFVKIGRPGYRVTKQRDPDNGQQSLLFEIDYPEIAEGVVPRHRFMSAYEQKVEPPDRKWQYLLFAAEPYETIGFKVPSREVDKSDTRFWSHWNKETKEFFLQFSFKLVDPRGGGGGRGPPPPPPPRLPPWSRPALPPRPPTCPRLPSLQHSPPDLHHQDLLPECSSDHGVVTFSIIMIAFFGELALFWRRFHVLVIFQTHPPILHHAWHARLAEGGREGG